MHLVFRHGRSWLQVDGGLFRADNLTYHPEMRASPQVRPWAGGPLAGTASWGPTGGSRAPPSAGCAVGTVPSHCFSSLFPFPATVSHPETGRAVGGSSGQGRCPAGGWGCGGPELARAAVVRADWAGDRCVGGGAQKTRCRPGGARRAQRAGWHLGVLPSRAIVFLGSQVGQDGALGSGCCVFVAAAG